MNVLKSKWNLLAIVLGISAFLGTSYVAYAAFVQWSREGHGTITSSPVDVLPPEAMTLFQDEELTDELLPDEVLEFAPVLEFQPPLDGLIGFDQRSSVTLFLKNDSDINLSFLNICCPAIRDPVTRDFWGSYATNLSECCNPIPPGEDRMIQIQIFNLRPGIFGEEFSFVVGALGEMTDGGEGVATLSVALEEILKSANQERER